MSSLRPAAPTSAVMDLDLSNQRRRPATEWKPESREPEGSEDFKPRSIEQLIALANEGLAPSGLLVKIPPRGSGLAALVLDEVSGETWRGLDLDALRLLAEGQLTGLGFDARG